MTHSNKLYIEIFILIFMFIVISLCILLSFYYMTPSNYMLFDYNPDNKRQFSVQEYIIKPHKEKMAKAKQSATRTFIAKPRKKRPGIHSKKKQSKNKNSKNYVKPYNKQGK